MARVYISPMVTHPKGFKTPRINLYGKSSFSFAVRIRNIQIIYCDSSGEADCIEDEAIVDFDPRDIDKKINSALKTEINSFLTQQGEGIVTGDTWRDIIRTLGKRVSLAFDEKEWGL